MQGIDAGDDAPRVTVESQADTPVATDRSVQRAADHAAAVAHALSKAGYEPRHLSITFSESGDLVLVARLDERHEPHVLPVRTSLLVRIAVGLILGLLLGFLGLPRLQLPSISLPQARSSAVNSSPRVETVQPGSIPTMDPVLVQLTPPVIPTALPTPTVMPTPTPLLFADGFPAPLAGWPNDPAGTAWFANGEYHLLARDSGRFVATGIPIGRPLQNARLRAEFHKLNGPPGGGFGLIVRDQSLTSERDGLNQAGQYLVLEVGDRGDIGIWHRDQTHWIDVVPWTHSAAVNSDYALNTLVVILQGNTLHFEVNGMVVADVSYDRLPTVGGVGLFAGGDLNEVALKSLRIDALS